MLAREVQGLKVPDQQAFQGQWREDYNRERPHEALARRCPADVFIKCAQPYNSTPEDLDYGNMLRRKITPQGTLSWKKDWVFISGTLAGWSVGLEARAYGTYNVWFGRLLLGEFDPNALTFTPVGRENQMTSIHRTDAPGWRRAPANGTPRPTLRSATAVGRRPAAALRQLAPALAFWLRPARSDQKTVLPERAKVLSMF